MPVYTDRKTNRLYIEFQYKGTRVKERLPAGTSKTDAAKLETKIKNDLMFQSHGVETRSSVVTFEKFVSEIFGPVADKFAPDRYNQTVLIVKAAMPYLKGKPMRSIKAADIGRFKQSRIDLPTKHKTPRKPATVEREMSIISSIFKMAVVNDVILYNPCGRVEKLTFDNIQDKILRREDEPSFFANMQSDWAKDVCKMVLNTGLRRNDLLRLTKFQVDRDQGWITLTQGKTKRRVLIPINAEVRAILDRRWSYKTLFGSPKTGKQQGSVTTAMRGACIRAKIPVLTIRDLRRTYGSRLAEVTEAATTARLLGQADLRMLPRYVRNLDLMQKASDDLEKRGKLKAVK